MFAYESCSGAYSAASPQLSWESAVTTKKKKTAGNIDTDKTGTGKFNLKVTVDPGCTLRNHYREIKKENANVLQQSDITC